jgi:hypothetical protein
MVRTTALIQPEDHFLMSSWTNYASWSGLRTLPHIIDVMVKSISMQLCNECVKKSSTYSLKDYPLIIKIIKMTLDILKNYICSKQTDGQTNAEPVNMSSLHLQCDPDNIEKRAKMLILKKTAPQNHILDNDDEPSSMYNAVQRLKKDLDFFVIIVMMYSFNEIGFQEALAAKL